MKEVTQVVYEAFDGSMFKTAKACAEHERDTSWKRLVGLNETQVLSALDGTDSELADALKTVGYQIAGRNRGTVKPKSPADNGPELPPPVGREPEPVGSLHD